MIESELEGKGLEVLSVHDLASQLGKESFILIRIQREQMFRNDRAQHGITEEFQSLIAHAVMPFAGGHAAVRKCLMVQLQIVWSSAGCTPDPIPELLIVTLLS